MSDESPYDPPKRVPEPQPRIVAPGITLVSAICRKGSGPGLLVLVDDNSAGLSIKDGVPSPVQKWGEEGYCAVEITRQGLRSQPNALQLAVECLEALPTCDAASGVGIVSYEPSAWALAVPLLQNVPKIVGAVVYDDAGSQDATPSVSIPLLCHYSGKAASKLLRSSILMQYDYPGQSAYFASPGSKSFNYAAEAVSHTRSLSHLKPLMKGPYFDLEALWDEHTFHEFGHRSVENTMNTMVEEPYVNNIPTLTGGIGRKDLTDFYANHFIFSNPEKTEIELVSRTVGINRVVDEFIFKFKHEQVIDWLLPGIPPTNVDCEVPFMAVVNFRGDRLYHEHITWDSASLLRQIGCMPEYVPFAQNALNGNGTKGMEVRLPVLGKETAAKLRDKNSLVSNEMLEYKPRTV